MFYMSIFRSAQCKTVSWILMIFIIVCGIATTLIVLLECRPVACFWDRDVKPGSCYDIITSHSISAGLSIAQDVFLVAFPACQVGKLQDLEMPVARPASSSEWDRLSTTPLTPEPVHLGYRRRDDVEKGKAAARNRTTQRS